MLDDLSNAIGETEHVYYDPSADEAAPLATGIYPAHISPETEVVRQRSWKKGSKTYTADIYNLRFEIAPESKDIAILDSKDAPAPETFAGKIVRGEGVFMFKESDGKNKRYQELVEAVSASFERIDTKDGKPVYQMPILSKEDVVGRPVLIRVYEDFKKNKQIKAVIENKWESGKIKKEDDIPF